MNEIDIYKEPGPVVDGLRRGIGQGPVGRDSQLGSATPLPNFFDVIKSICDCISIEVNSV